MSYITQVVNTDKNMTAFKKGMHASDLDQLLSTTGPFTLFAPSDLAFGKLDAGTLDKLLEPENKISLTDLVNNHVVEGKISYIDLKDGDKLTSLNGKEILVSVTNGKVNINGSNIQTHDVKATNGVIHFLDAVLKN